MQSIGITSRPHLRMRKWNHLSKFRKTSTKVIPIENTLATFRLTICQGFERGSK